MSFQFSHGNLTYSDETVNICWDVNGNFKPLLNNIELGRTYLSNTNPVVKFDSGIVVIAMVTHDTQATVCFHENSELGDQFIKIIRGL